jgi:TolB protein
MWSFGLSFIGEEMKRALKNQGVLLAGLAILGMLTVRPIAAQDWFKTGTGLGVAKVRVALPDTAARSTFATPLPRTFHDVLWNDLQYSGILDLVSPSMYPLQAPGQPSDLKAQEWSNDPANAYMVAYGNLTTDGTNIAFAGYLSDVRNTSAPLALQKIYRGPATDVGARHIAHQFADDIIGVLSGGLPGIAETQIVFVGARGGSKEIWVMDYDGSNGHQLTHMNTVALTPRWSPDSTRIAFTCFLPSRGVTSAQICIYSAASDHLISFPRYPGTNSSPSWSPDGKQIAFESSQGGDPEIFIADADGGHLHRVTFAVGVSTSPAWNPKTGKQLAFVSDRAGTPVLYLSNSDGSNVEKVDLPDMGYVIDPAWSPNGQMLAFSWRRPSGNYDIYAMDIVSHQLVELTRDAARNERPSWAPDGRHIVFESTRTGTRQIWSMLADGSQPRQLTFEGANESPSWSSK